MLRSTWLAGALGLAAFVSVGGCAAVPTETAGMLSSYADLAPSDGLLTHARVAVNKDDVLAASTVRIIPTTFSDAAAQVALSDAQRSLLAAVVDRSVCVGLSDRFHVAAPGEAADLSVHAAITYIGLTDARVAAASRVMAIGASVAEGVYLPNNPIPIPSPRIPVGMGGLAVEAEALDHNGHQAAAMVWARGADAFTTKPKVSVEGDAYDMAKAFGDDFSRLLVTGASPFKHLPHLPSGNTIKAMFGGAPKEAACDAFGRGPGVVGLVGDAVGLPPEWTDKGAPAPAPPPPPQ
jgi:Protein of unknown function (DUF3313)